MGLILLLLINVGCKTLDKHDKGLIIALYALCVVDYYQTDQILDEPFIGEDNHNISNRQDAAIVIFGGATAVVAVASLLPSDWRKYVLGLYTGYRTNVVFENQELLKAYE
jgi:hypothetical protein